MFVYIFTWYLSRLILGFLFNCSPFFYVVFYLTETSAYCDIFNLLSCIFNYIILSLFAFWDE